MSSGICLADVLCRVGSGTILRCRTQLVFWDSGYFRVLVNYVACLLGPGPCPFHCAGPRGRRGPQRGLGPSGIAEGPGVGASEGLALAKKKRVSIVKPYIIIGNSI